MDLQCQGVKYIIYIPLVHVHNFTELQTDNKTGDSKPSLVHLPTEEALG